MWRRKSSKKAPDREKNWEKTFNAVVELSRTLHRDREVLVERIKFLNGVIYQMKMAQKCDSAKAEIMLGLKDREAFIYKHRYENAHDELADFQEWFQYLSQKCSEPNITSSNVSNGEVSRTLALENEVRKLKSEIEQHKLQKNTEVSALLAEKSFIWNQFNKMESDFTSQLNQRCRETEQANEKVQLLVGRAEQLQASNEKLRTELSMMESESKQRSEEISRLLKEIEYLKATSGSPSPLLHPCRMKAASSCREGKNTTTSCGRITSMDKESEKKVHTKPFARKSTGGKAPKKKFIKKGSSNSKGKLVDAIGIPDTPRLFSSEFKVPKLKSSSSTPV